jgi:DDE family transposase
VDRVKAYRGTFPYEKALRKRRVWVEPLFAEAKDWPGLRRFTLRGLENVNAEALLIAAGQNVKRLVAARERGPKSWAQAAALRIPAQTKRHPSDHITSHRRLSCHRWGRFSTGWQAKSFRQ